MARQLTRSTSALVYRSYPVCPRDLHVLGRTFYKEKVRPEETTRTRLVGNITRGGASEGR